MRGGKGDTVDLTVAIAEEFTQSTVRSESLEARAFTHRASGTVSFAGRSTIPLNTRSRRCHVGLTLIVIRGLRKVASTSDLTLARSTIDSIIPIRPAVAPLSGDVRYLRPFGADVAR